MYWSGPSTLRKMKEIWKVVQKLLHEQASAGSGGDGRLRHTNQYQKIKSPLVYRADLMMKLSELTASDNNQLQVRIINHHLTEFT